jgi:hypothetical protein
LGASLKVISIGDSYIYGTELMDCGPDRPSQSTWPALYAKSIQAEYQCLARPGHTSQYVLRALLESIVQQDQQCFYIIHWPSAIRTEYVDKKDDSWIQITPNMVLPESTAESESVRKIYYSTMNSLLGDKWNNLLMIYTAIQALKSAQHRFAMTVVDDFLYHSEFHNPDYVTFLQKNTHNYITWFENLPFHNWTRLNQWPEGPHTHPLEQAHAQAFEYVKDIYNNILKD